MRHEHCFELLERKLTLLADLAAALRASTDALVRLDLEAIHHAVGNQERLCGEIRSLDRGLRDWQRKWAAERSRDCRDGEIEALVQRVANAQSEVRQLNQRHAALLRRSRRTLDAMRNFLRSAAPTYANPRPAAAPAGERG